LISSELVLLTWDACSCFSFVCLLLIVWVVGLASLVRLLAACVKLWFFWRVYLSLSNVFLKINV
jgi:hypothetical protein